MWLDRLSLVWHVLWCRGVVPRLALAGGVAMTLDELIARLQAVRDELADGSAVVRVLDGESEYPLTAAMARVSPEGGGAVIDLTAW